MRRADYDEYAQRLEEAHNRLGKAQKYYEEALRNAGLSIEQGVVRYADSPSNTSIAPTWEAQRAAQVRTYEAETRIADIEKIARRGVQAVKAVHSDINAGINANESMHPALENGLREIEDATKNAATFLISQHAGYTNQHVTNQHVDYGNGYQIR
jgi:hypothetical protein